ncbi:MAG: ABC transporter ATP-binding protein [Polyangiaceae bacterium]|nr:ABC transporter ATP-binding protein [Polyangiaceae bacterium]
MSAGLRLEGLHRRHPGAERAAVDALELEVSEGEVVCLVGPSGCGKSSTLRLVAGLDLPDAGRVLIDGADVTRLPPQERDVAMVFQGFALYPHMKVKQILEFPLEMRRVPKRERARAVGEAAELLGITRLLERRPGQLSGGEQQRVAMGRAIVRRPKVFLFDEPLSNLDAALRAELRVELGKLLARLGRAAVYVTHDQVEAMTLGHRIAVMRAGKLEQCDTPRRIYEAPASTFVASFFGAPPMNLLGLERDGALARAAGLALPAPPGGGARLVLGVRPEHVRVEGHAPPGVAERADAAAVRARVTAVEQLGSETHVELDAAGQRLRARLAGFDAPALGGEVTARFDVERVVWFDGETERAL